MRRWNTQPRFDLVILVSDIDVHEFSIPVDLHYEGRGLGTYTATLQDGRRLQFSAGMLLNWGVLDIKK